MAYGVSSDDKLKQLHKFRNGSWYQILETRCLTGIMQNTLIYLFKHNTDMQY